MPRVKRGKTHLKRRKALLARTKGFMWGRKSKIKQAKTAAVKADKYAYRDRRNKKRTMRALWQLRIGAAARAAGMNYSGLMDKIHKSNIELDRKILSQLAKDYPKTFDAVVESAKK